MAGRDFEPAKVISIETTEDHTLVNIEVPSYMAFLNYTPHQADQLTNVRISRSCPKSERDVIIRVCDEDEKLLYESDSDDDDDDGDQPPPRVGEESSGTDRKKVENGKTVTARKETD